MGFKPQLRKFRDTKMCWEVKASCWEQHCQCIFKRQKIHLYYHWIKHLYAVKDGFTTNYNFNIQIVEILQKVLANAAQVLRTEFHSPSSYTKLESAWQFQDPLHPHLYQCVQLDILVLLHTSIFSCRINNRSNYIQPDWEMLNTVW